MRLEENMGFQRDHIIILSPILLFVLSVTCTSIDMEQSNKRFMGFEEENSLFNIWIDENIKNPNLMDPVWGYKAAEVEGELLSIIDDAEFYALYIESNIDNGIWNVFLLVHNGSGWIQTCWENGRKIILEKPVLENDWKKKFCNFHFSDDIVVDLGKIMIFDATSVFLFITCHDRLKRFAVYNPRTMVYGDSDDRYIRQIQRMIRHIRRNYLWFRLTKKRKT